MRKRWKTRTTKNNLLRVFKITINSIEYLHSIEFEILTGEFHMPSYIRRAKYIVCAFIVVMYSPYEIH